MGRGVSAGGGQSSLGYLFGGDPVPPPSKAQATAAPAVPAAPVPSVILEPSVSSDIKEEDPKSATCEEEKPEAPKVGTTNNNYHRDGGQNTGNFITDRPTTKVHAAPGGGSSLGYLFGGK